MDQQMTLATEFFDLVRERKKRGTVRAGVRQVELAALRLTSPDGKQQERVLVKRVSYTRYGALTDDDARMDGYAIAEQLQAALRRFYPRLTHNDPVTVVEWY